MAGEPKTRRPQMKIDSCEAAAKKLGVRAESFPSPSSVWLFSFNSSHNELHSAAFNWLRGGTRARGGLPLLFVVSGLKVAKWPKVLALALPMAAISGTFPAPPLCASN